jgi:hypothetical protein
MPKGRNPPPNAHKSYTRLITAILPKVSIAGSILSRIAALF